VSPQRQAVWLLGVCQCVCWGVLYYGFSVLLVPMEQELGLSRTSVAGAFSLGLLAMALAAPLVGKAFDRGHGPVTTQASALLAAAGLVLASRAHGAASLYAAWLVLGVAMAALLYEAAFALVIRAIADPFERLRALAAITVVGGLASTVFLPLLAAVTERCGWRFAELAGAAAILIAAWIMQRRVLPVLSDRSAPVARPAPARAPATAHFFPLLAVFTSSTVAAMGLTTLLIPLLLSRGASPTGAASVLAMLGVTQLPGRIWVLRGGRQPATQTLASLPLVLQGAGLGGVALAPTALIAAFGVAVFGLGAGLHTLARPWLVQRIYGVRHAGYWNGRIALVQGFGRAIGPLAVVALAAWAGTGAVLAGLGLSLLGLVPLAHRMSHAVPAAAPDDAPQAPQASPAGATER
jgi:MFS family permease